MFTLPYMSDFLATLLIMIVAGVIVIFPAAYFGGKIGAILAFSALTAFSCFVVVYGKSLGRSFANSNAPVSIDSDMLLIFFSIALLYAFIAFTAFCLRQVVHGEGAYKIPLLICSFILVGIPMTLYGNQIFIDYRIKIKNYSSTITIAHPKEFPVLIDQIKFIDSKSKKSTFGYSRFYEDDRVARKFEGISDEIDSLQCYRYYTKMMETLIPISFDSFELSWYSLLENRFYRDTFPVDRTKLKVAQSYDGQMTVSDMLITILPDGNVDLLKMEYGEVMHVTPYFDVAFKSVEGQSLDSIYELFTPIWLAEDRAENYKRSFEKLQNGTAKGLTAEEILSLRIVPTYGIDISIDQKQGEVNELKDIEIVDFYLNQYQRTADFLRKINKKPLPRLVNIKVINDKDKRMWIDVIFDKKLLLQQFLVFTENHKGDVSFDINIDLEDFDKSQVSLISGDEKTELSGWLVRKNR